LFIRRKSGTYRSYWGKEFPVNFKLDVKTGSFGSVHPEASDFSEAPTASDVACFAGRPVKDNYTMRMDLSEAALNAINKTGITQFRLEIVTDTSQRESLIQYFNGDTTEFEGPFMDIYYDTATIITNIRNNFASELRIFPNPAKDKLYLTPDKKMTPGWYAYEIYDEKGALITVGSLQVQHSDLPVDISGLQSGTYVISLRNKDQAYGATFVKSQ
jgi:hypothetical protein